MVYTMVFYVDGACRGNGKAGSVAAAAACRKYRGSGPYRTLTRMLPRYPAPTSQRAEIDAVLLALETAQQTALELSTSPELDITIYTDSKYVVGCMTTWRQKWRGNGFISSSGGSVVNKDLLNQAYEIQDWLLQEGAVKYVWIPRTENMIADQAANDALDG